ncbi:protein AF-10 isoform X2 [Agrilus planipennis]|uniref:Protein AF-10 isoform X2 n=1 Tax=Agrilus planipennis TaxID=224129 RepID=A0A7F5RC97_AGRPL|nr:protein AF-10 isoform X2 [Agrilus planipennis]
MTEVGLRIPLYIAMDNRALLLYIKKCELCPSKYGALKKTDNSGWAHVVCALYIPEVRFGNVTTMEPIQLQLIPAERFNKVCYICEEQGKPSNATVGACMQCNKTGCKQQFHVTCAQGLGLLCEEAGNYLDNVKYCGYCQHHYGKLKKGGNVKTIPPYKPVSAESHTSDSSSEKETDPTVALNSKLNPSQISSSSTTSLTTSSSSTSMSSSSLNKRNKSSSSGKISSANSKSNSSISKSTSSSSHNKTLHNSSGKSDRDKVKVPSLSVKSVKGTDDGSAPPLSIPNNNSVDSNNKNERKEVKSDADDSNIKPDLKESKSGKKRKANSRTPTPITVPSESVSVVVSASSLISSNESSVGSLGNAVISSEKTEGSEKLKKMKTELPISISQPTVVLTATALPLNIKRNSPSASTTEPITPSSSPHNAPSQPVIQSNVTQGSLVVSLPLANANLSPNSHILNNQTPFVNLSQDHSNSSSSIPGRSTPSNSTASGSTITGGITNQNNGMVTSEMNGDGLKISYEKQASSSSLQMELERITPIEQEGPTKRPRSRSSEKIEKEKMTRAKKRGSNDSSSQYNTSGSNNHNITTATANVNNGSVSRRSSRSQHSPPPPSQPSQSNPLGVSRSVSQIKESPPSSPSSESQGSTTTNRTKNRGRKSAPASISSHKDTKDNLKAFQNGMTAPHMMGNQLNPNSNMAQKMTDHLNSELEAHSIFNMNESSNLIGPQLHHKVIAGARASSSGGSSTASATSGGFSMLGGSGGSIPQTLDQLLERQWEQGSQFLMEQAQHFDIASLLSCLHQLRAENLRLEEHVSSLLQRRDHLLAVNARLAIPLTGQPATPQATHPHTVNNIHPTVSAHSESSRTRHNGVYTGHGQMPPQHQSLPVENGLPSDPSQQYPHQHRSPAGNNQNPSSSSVRWS